MGLTTKKKTKKPKKKKKTFLVYELVLNFDFQYPKN